MSLILESTWESKFWQSQPSSNTETYFLFVFTGCSWPGICSELTKFLTQHIEDGLQKKKGMDQQPMKLLRKFVKLAEDRGRSGVLYLLQSGIAQESLIHVSSRDRTHLSAIISPLVIPPPYCFWRGSQSHVLVNCLELYKF